MSKRGRPPKIGAVRNKSGRIRYGKPDIKPKEGPKWSREYQWLVDNLSEPAREAARWYAEWIKHRNYWLGYDEWKLPGDDLTVSTRLGRKSFTALVKVPGAYKSKRPGLSSTGVEPDDREALVLAPSTSLPLTGRFASAGRPSAAEAAAAALQDDAAARLQQQSYKTQKDGPFPPRKPHKPAYAPPPTDNDARCPECTGGCALQKEGNDPCALRERIRADDMALKLILQQRIAPVDDLTVPLGKEIPETQRDSAGQDWEDQAAAARKGDKRRRTGDVRRKRWLLDHFALDGQFPAPDEIAPLEEILMKLYHFFKDAPSRADWDDSYEPRAKTLTVAERMALYAKQSPQASAHEVILHVAKTEGYDLKYLGRVQSASQAAVAGGDLYKKAS